MSNISCLAEKQGRKRNEKDRRFTTNLCRSRFAQNAVYRMCSKRRNSRNGFSGVYRTDNQGYKDFCEKLYIIEDENECCIELAVEATGNARYFENKMEAEGFVVLDVNTSKFKVITMSTKKTDAKDAATMAFYLSKDMLLESHLCDLTSEEIRRMLKTRSILVSSTVKIKNQIHGMLLGYGIEIKSAQFQSKKKRQELINDLADQHFSQFTASSLEVALNILDDIYAQVKKIEEQIR